MGTWRILGKSQDRHFVVFIKYPFFRHNKFLFLYIHTSFLLLSISKFYNRDALARNKKTNWIEQAMVLYCIDPLNDVCVLFCLLGWLLAWCLHVALVSEPLWRRDWLFWTSTSVPLFYERNNYGKKEQEEREKEREKDVNLFL
jgi:hypothetical protein